MSRPRWTSTSQTALIFYSSLPVTDTEPSGPRLSGLRRSETDETRYGASYRYPCYAVPDESAGNSERKDQSHGDRGYV